MINSRYEDAKALHITTKVLNLDMTEKFSNLSTIDVPADGVTKIVSLPDIPDLSPTYFVSLRISDASGKLIGSNFYWLSTKAETLDWSHSNWYTTPTASYADFTALAGLPKIKLRIAERSEQKGENETKHVMLENPTNSLAFFVRLELNKEQGGPGYNRLAGIDANFRFGFLQVNGFAARTMSAVPSAGGGNAIVGRGNVNYQSRIWQFRGRFRTCPIVHLQQLQTFFLDVGQGYREVTKGKRFVHRSFRQVEGMRRTVMTVHAFHIEFRK